MTDFWQPTSTAPREPAAPPAAVGRYSRMSQGPEIALLGMLDGCYILVRGCWARQGDAGFWWDLDADESIEFEIIGWARLPDQAEKDALIGADRPVGFT